VSIGIFQNFSPWSILANILVWPVVGMAMLSGALALCFTWVAPVSYAIGHFCYFWLAWIQAVASWLGELSPRYTFESCIRIFLEVLLRLGSQLCKTPALLTQAARFLATPPTVVNSPTI
jgi:hypothetical protein